MCKLIDVTVSWGALGNCCMNRGRIAGCPDCFCAPAFRQVVIDSLEHLDRMNDWRAFHGGFGE